MNSPNKLTKNYSIECLGQNLVRITQWRDNEDKTSKLENYRIINSKGVLEVVLVFQESEKHLAAVIFMAADGQCWLRFSFQTDAAAKDFMDEYAAKAAAAMSLVPRPQTILPR